MYIEEWHERQAVQGGALRAAATALAASLDTTLALPVSVPVGVLAALVTVLLLLFRPDVLKRCRHAARRLRPSTHIG